MSIFDTFAGDYTSYGGDYWNYNNDIGTSPYSGELWDWYNEPVGWNTNAYWNYDNDIGNQNVAGVYQPGYNMPTASDIWNELPADSPMRVFEQTKPAPADLQRAAQAVLTSDLGKSGGGGIWDSLIKLLGPLAGAFLAKQGTKQATPTTSSPLINQSYFDKAFAGLDPVLRAMLSQITTSGFTPNMYDRLSSALGFLDSQRAEKEAAARGLLQRIKTPWSLSPYSLEAAELADKLAKDDTQLREEIERQLSQMGYTRRGYGDADAIIADALTKYQRDAMAIKQALGKQEEDLMKAWGAQLPSLLEAYEKSYGPEELTKEILMAGLPVDYAINQLAKIGKSVAEIATIMAGAAKQGQVMVGDQGTQKEWWVPIIEQAIKGWFPELAATTATTGTSGEKATWNPLGELYKGITGIDLRSLVGF